MQTPAAFAVTSEIRLLGNPGFESGLSSWTADAGVSLVSAGAHGGSVAVRMVDSASDGGVSLRSAPLAVVPGEELTAGIHVRQEVAGAGGSLLVEFWRADGSRTTPVIGVPAPSTTAWQQISVAATAPDDAVTATVLAYSSFANRGTTYWDDATLSAAPPPSRRVENPGFEAVRDPNLPPEWTVTRENDPVTLVRGSGVVHSGKAALQIVDNDNERETFAVSDAVPVSANETITAAAWANPIRGSGARIYVEFLDRAGTRIGVNSAGVGTTGTGWRQVKVSGKAPAGATTVTVRLYHTLAGTGTTRWDDVTLRSDRDASYDAALRAEAQVLFVGDQRVESFTGVKRVVQPGTRGPNNGIVLNGFSDWDANPRMGGTVLRGRAGEPAFKMWYTTTGGTGYATSTDGITWDRNGRTGALPAAVQNVVENPAWTPGSGVPRYFGLSTANGNFYPMRSNDGITFTRVPNATVIPGFDTAAVSYDPVTRLYVAMTRHHVTAPYGPRTIWVSTSADFTSWTTARPSFAADVYDDDLIPADVRTSQIAASEVYGMPAFRYGDQYLALPWIFDVVYRPNLTGNPGPDTGSSHFNLIASQDRLNWSRASREPLVGNPRGNWDYGFKLSADGFVDVQQNDGTWQSRLYYGSFAGEHLCLGAEISRGWCHTHYGNSKIGMLSWPKDRFVSFHADGAGTVTTRPIAAAGTRLTVNYDPGAGGALRVEVLDAAGNPIEGYGAADATPITTNALAPGAAVSWGTRTELPTGAVRLRFHLSGGDLYSFAVL